MGDRKVQQKKSQPKKLLTTGELSSGVGGAQGVSQSSISIKLIFLNSDLILLVALRNRVSVKWADDGFYCFYKGAILGKIPKNYNQLFIDTETYRGVIIELNDQPPLVVIQIKK